MLKRLISALTFIALYIAGLYWVKTELNKLIPKPVEVVTTGTRLDYTSEVFVLLTERGGTTYQGTVFTISDNIGLTAGHMCDGAQKMTVVTTKTEIRVAAVKNIEQSPKVDVCLVKGNFKRLKHVPIATPTGTADLGRTLRYVGYPKNRYRITFSKLLYYSYERLPLEEAGDYSIAGYVYVVDTQCIPGNSGGPLYAEDGNTAIGIVSWYDRGICHIFPITEAIRLLRDTNVRWRSI